MFAIMIIHYLNFALFFLTNIQIEYLLIQV